MERPDSPYDAAAASHRALREIRRQLERHPVVDHARGFPPDGHSRVTAELDPTEVATDDGSTELDSIQSATGADSATLTVRWFAGETADDPPAFSFHYSDESGVDFGWHHEPNPHVDGWGHFQERDPGNDEYDYRPYEFSTLVPGRVVWEVLSALVDRVS